MWCAKTAVLDFWRSIRRVARAAAASAAPIRPSGTFPRRRGKEGVGRRGKGGVCRQGKQALVERRCSAGNPLPSPAGGRRWRAAPDEGRLVPCESYLQEYRQTAAPIRPSGTFPRRRGREAFAGRGSRRWWNAAAALATRCLLPRAGEGGAQRRMRGVGAVRVTPAGTSPKCRPHPLFGHLPPQAGEGRRLQAGEGGVGGTPLQRW
ncbi:hypothetical protein FHR48_003398 [Xanthomonas arboricola]|nr:hypothetical protein [Xanthomonas cannabis]